MKPSSTRRLDALLCGFIAAVVVTGVLHVTAMFLPDWFSSRAVRQASAGEKIAGNFSNFWLTRATWLMPVVAASCFALGYMLFPKKPKSSSRGDSGTG